MLSKAFITTLLTVFFFPLTFSHPLSLGFQKRHDGNGDNGSGGRGGGCGSCSVTNSNVGAIIGVVAGVILLTIFGFLCYRHRKSRLAPSMAHRVASDRNVQGWRRINDLVDNSRGPFRPEIKQHPGNTVRGGMLEPALQRKAQIMEDLRFEAAVRDGVKA